MNKTTEWQQRITEWQSSGLSAKAFCAQNGLILSTLRYWTKRLRQKPPHSPPIQFTKLTPITSQSPAPAHIFIELNNLRIAVQPGFDPPTLSAVLATLQRSQGAP